MTVAGFACCCGFLVACGQPPAAEPLPAERPFAGSLTPPPSPSAEVVAKVNDDVIYDQDVAAHARANGLSARDALAELIDLALLAQQALRAGLAEDKDVIEAHKKVLVRRFLQESFAARYASPADVPVDELRAAWDLPQVHARFSHDTIYFLEFVRFSVPADAADSKRNAILAFASAVREEGVKRGSKTAAELYAVGQKLAPAHQQEGTRMSHFRAATTTKNAVPSFRAAMMSVGEGGIAQPALTDFGVDLILVKKIDPERHQTFAQAEPELRALLFTDSRQEAFLRWTDELLGRHHIVQNAQAFVDPDTRAPAGP